MSVGCCGPFDEDESDPDSDYDPLSIEAEAYAWKIDCSCVSCLKCAQLSKASPRRLAQIKRHQ